MTQSLKDLEQVLQAYGLVPISVTQKNNVYKVITSSGAFALKSLARDKEYPFMQIQSALRTNGVHALPVFITNNGELFVRTNHQSYYLTPWADDEVRNDFLKWEGLIGRLAELHRKTGKWVPRAVMQSGEERTDWPNHFAVLERFMDQAEHQPYPSPFEQRLLLLFHRIMGDAEKAYRIKDELSRRQPEEERVVLCHGRPQIDHIGMFQREAYLFNWEHAYWGSLVSDITQCFRSCDLDPEWIIRLYDQYQSGHPLKVSEKKYLLSELLLPDAFVDIVRRYREKKAGSEWKAVAELHELCEKRERMEAVFTYIEKEISDETKVESDPPLEKTDIETNEQDQNDDIEGRRPENGPDHLKDGKG
ncbi:MAG: hypothetical protein ACO1OC_05070 [Tuberibacillus sp.]